MLYGTILGRKIKYILAAVRGIKVDGKGDVRLI